MDTVGNLTLTPKTMRQGNDEARKGREEEKNEVCASISAVFDIP